MVRAISAGGLAKLATLYATEPITIVEVDWIAGDDPISYADRDVQFINGRILDMSELDNIVSITNSNNSQEITITLDDTDGSIKAILDAHDVHKRTVNVYQWFDGLALSDKFLLFRGQISSPVTWRERNKQVSFTIVSQLEDKEIGFSAEEGQFPYLPKDLVGKPWPMIFGKCLDVPALQINKAVTGSTLCGVGIYSGRNLHSLVPFGGDNCGLGISLAMGARQISFNNVCAAAWERLDPARAASLNAQSNDIREQMADSVSQYILQQHCAQTQRSSKLDNEQGLGCNPVRILGGEDFPQGTAIELNIGGGLFTGVMTDDEFYISSRIHPENEEVAETTYASISSALCETATPVTPFDYSMDVPFGEGDFGDEDTIHHHGYLFCTSDTTSRPNASQVARHFWAESGSRVVISDDEPITYIVSITPGTVLAVKAFKDLNGERKLVNVPNDLWTASTQNYGPITAVQVVVNKPLSTIVDQNWEDTLYVTFESTIGPDIVEILEYLIDTYTDLDYDATSFDAVRTKLTPFPANFPILDRKNTLEVLKEIAFQARCAIWLSNGVFYLKYLPEEPVADSTVTVSDIDTENGVEVELSPTEEIVTKMVVYWHLSWAAEEPEKIILRHNVKKYGTQEREFDFYIYNQPDIVLKCATFWLIRMSKTWKRIRFKTALQKLNLETFDCVDLQFGSQNYVASSNVKAIVEKANYNSNDLSIDFECLTPIEAGTMEPYVFFWPAAVSPSLTFPTPPEIAAGFAGGDGIGKDATGDLPVGFTDSVGNLNGVVFVGGPNVVFRPQSDRGDRTPTDVGFTAQEIITPAVYAELETSTNPNPDLTLNYVDPIRPLKLPDVLKGGKVIDIRRTKIVDSANPEVNSTLSSLIREINDANELVLKTDAKFSDGTTEAAFDFKYDEDGSKFGAGTAFLKD